MRYYYYNKNNIFFDEEYDIIQPDQLMEFLQHYKLSQYFEIFVAEGFDRLLSLFDITESDLIYLNVKRGHRRLLQRAIATARGVSTSTPIVINYGYEEPSIAYTPKPGTVPIAAAAVTTPITTTTTATSVIATAATDVVCNDIDIYSNEDDYYSYRRSHHRKRRQYVPSKPVTPFDELIHEVQSENSNKSLSDVTAIAIERWNRLTGIEKEKYEREALHANSDYVMG